MTDEAVVEPQTTTSDEQTVATPAQTTEVVQDENITQDVAEKTYTQKEYDEATAKIRKKAEAVAERRALKVYAEKLEGLQQKPIEHQQDTSKPVLAENPTIAEIEAHVEAVADWKLRQRDIEVRQQSEVKQQAQNRSKANDLYAEAGKLPGFDVEAFEANLTPTIASVVMESEVAPKLMAYMSENPEEIERIASLSSVRQAAEIGKLEAKLLAVKQTKVSSAPAPIKPVGGRSGMQSKAPSDMSISELREYEKTRGARYS